MTAAPAASRRAVAFILATLLVDTIGFGIVIPVLPGLITQLTGEGIADAAVHGGWLAFAFAVAQFFCAPVLGNLSDRFGRRPVLLLSLLAFGVDYAVMGFAPTLAWLYAGRIVAGMAGAAFSPAYAYMADVTPPEQRARNFGLLGAAFGAGFVLGPALGGLLAQLGPRAPFFVASGCALANFAFGCVALPETLDPAHRRPFEWRRANPLGALAQMRRHPAVLGLLGVMFLWQLGHQVLPATWSFYSMFKFGWSPVQVGASLAAVGVLMMISQGGLTGPLVARLKERRAAVVGLVCGATMYFGYAFATQGWMVYAVMLVWLLGGLTYPSVNALLSRQVPRNAQGELQGAVASLYSLSAIAGPPLMAHLFSAFSAPAARVYFPGAALFCAGLLTLGALALLLRSAPVEPAAAPMEAA
ncbi:MAG TPA: TCR/Tet family MFS transporter [Candidatus Binatia bacterium]|nr:TCR/Tet family MFS transporter [Candidatus Binatia bacterium]